MRLIFTIDTWMNSHEWIWVALSAIATAILAVVSCIEIKKRKTSESSKKGNGAKETEDQVKGDTAGNSSNKTENYTQSGNATGGSVVNNNVVNNSVTTNGFQAEDVLKIVREFNNQNSDNINAQLEPEVNHRLDEFESLLISRLKEIDDKLNRFAEPSIQSAVRDAVTGYVENGGEDEREAMVDLLIERVKVEEHTSKQSIIDEAIKVLPKLSKECIAVLAVLSYTTLVIHRTKETLDKCIRSMDPVLDLLPQVGKLDIQYLSQVNCLSPLHNCIIVRDLVKSSKKHYSMAFCHPADVEHSAEFMRKYGLRLENRALIADNTNGNANEQIKKIITLRMIFNFNDEGTITPLLLNKDTYEEVLSQDSGMKTMIPDVQKLLSSCEVLSDQEIVSYYERFNPNWSVAIRMLKDKPLNRYDLQPIGLYIGARKLFKLNGMILPMEELL